MRGWLNTRQGASNVNVPDARITPEGKMRLHRIARELRLTDQILSPDLDTVSIVDSGEAPAWTSLDGDHVTFACSHMPEPVDRLSVAVWLGTNAHELGHVLWSPRTWSPLMQRVIGAEETIHPGVLRIHNVVEDQRQERLLIGQFAPWRAYLTAALAHHLHTDNDGAWVLLAGRTWLPGDVRAEARRRFVIAMGEPAAAAIARIIGGYQSLDDPGEADADTAWALILELHELLGSSGLATLPTRVCTVMEGGAPGTTTPVHLPADADADGVPVPDADGRDDGGDEDAGDDGKSGKGAGHGEGSFKQRLAEAARDALDDDDAAADDVERVLDTLTSGRAGDGAAGEGAIGDFIAVPDAARALHREVADALLDLKDASEPGWVKRVNSGRLNTRRWATDPLADFENLFDRYEPGQLDAAELELIVLLDVSGSMSGQTMRLAQATWAIRHAVDDLEGTCTVLTYDDGPHRVMAAPGERPDDRLFHPWANGGTNPTSALAEAYRIIADSQARNRLVIILTDGEWNGSSRTAEPIIRAINATGAVTALCELGAFAGGNDHGCGHLARIDDPADLARLFRSIAAEQIGQWR